MHRNKGDVLSPQKLTIVIYLFEVANTVTAMVNLR